MNSLIFSIIWFDLLRFRISTTEPLMSIPMYIAFRHIPQSKTNGFYFFCWNFSKMTIDWTLLTLQIAKIDRNILHWSSHYANFGRDNVRTIEDVTHHNIVIQSGVSLWFLCSNTTILYTFVCSIRIIWINQSHLVSCDSDKFNSQIGTVR